MIDNSGHGVGIPKIYKFGSTDRYTYMVMELLGPNLEMLFRKDDGKWPLKTILQLGIRMVGMIYTPN